MIVAGDSHVAYTQRFSGTFNAPLDLRRFPKDKQLLRVHLILQGLDLDQVKLTVDEEMTGQSEKFTIADWHVEKGSAQIVSFKLRNAVIRPGIAYEIEALRDIGYYRLKILSTLVLIVLMSWTAFWMVIGDVAPKLAMAASAILTLIAYRFYLSGLVPKISYMTQMDYFVMGATVLVFSTFIGILTVNHLHTSGRDRTAKRVQLWCRLLVPAALALLIVIVER